MKQIPRLLLVLLFSSFALEARVFFLHDGQRVLFLGDSITQDGRYVEMIEAWLIADRPAQRIEIIKLGLGSETVEGLTEPDHPFPRPNVHDRLDSALEKSSPNVVVACYGMNDGIYHPFSQQRFEAYQDGIRRLVAEAQAASAAVVLLTPPTFDSLFAKAAVGAGAAKFGYLTPYRNYDSEVLMRYGAWLMTLRREGCVVVDIHKPMIDATHKARKADPTYTLSPDAIHPGDEGQWIMARTVLEAWGARRPSRPDPDLLRLIHEKWQVLGPAWLSRVGHKLNSPPVDFEAAQAKAIELERRARALPLPVRRRNP
jgi:lysophospholipase L1-like esterase